MFYCVAPSCSHVAEAGSQYCDAHSGKRVQWFSITRADGSRCNVRAESEAAARAVANRS
jgi:hypothetical protein